MEKIPWENKKNCIFKRQRNQEMSQEAREFMMTAGVMFWGMRDFVGTMRFVVQKVSEEKRKSYVPAQEKNKEDIAGFIFGYDKVNQVITLQTVRIKTEAFDPEKMATLSEMIDNDMTPLIIAQHDENGEGPFTIFPLY